VGGLLVGIPAGPFIDSQFMAGWLGLQTGGVPVKTILAEGPYVALNMRGIVTKALETPGWDRLLVLETDMICPPDTLLRHMAHTAPVVGGLYFMHYPPYNPVAMLKHGKGMWRQITPDEIRQLAEAGEGVFKVDSVGLGCTSIRRDILENWPKHLPYFQSAYTRKKQILEGSFGEVSHDAWFCNQVSAQGHDVFLDPNIRCDHLSKVRVNLASYANFHGISIAGVNTPATSPEETVLEVALPTREAAAALGAALVT
jgi:hypothetical protein